ncbi:MAG: isoamylase early set domain-containing protein [Acidimicrobiales bacterium]
MEVTFRLPAEVGGRSACLAGDFNDWSTTSTPLEETDGELVAVLTLPAAASYRFRYFLDGERWENDWAADRYTANDFGGEDSVLDLPASDTIDLTAATPDPPPQKRAKRVRVSAPSTGE